MQIDDYCRTGLFSGRHVCLDNVLCTLIQIRFSLCIIIETTVYSMYNVQCPISTVQSTVYMYCATANNGCFQMVKPFHLMMVIDKLWVISRIDLAIARHCIVRLRGEIEFEWSHEYIYGEYRIYLWHTCSFKLNIVMD